MGRCFGLISDGGALLRPGRQGRALVVLVQAVTGLPFDFEVSALPGAAPFLPIYIMPAMNAACTATKAITKGNKSHTLQTKNVLLPQVLGS